MNIWIFHVMCAAHHKTSITHWTDDSQCKDVRALVRLRIVISHHAIFVSVGCGYVTNANALLTYGQCRRYVCLFIYPIVHVRKENMKKVNEAYKKREKKYRCRWEWDKKCKQQISLFACRWHFWFSMACENRLKWREKIIKKKKRTEFIREVHFLFNKYYDLDFIRRKMKNYFPNKNQLIQQKKNQIYRWKSADFQSQSSWVTDICLWNCVKCSSPINLMLLKSKAWHYRVSVWTI